MSAADILGIQLIRLCSFTIEKDARGGGMPAQQIYDILIEQLRVSAISITGLFLHKA